MLNGLAVPAFPDAFTALHAALPSFYRLGANHLRRFSARMGLLEKHYRVIFDGNVISPAGHEWTFVH